MATAVNLEITLGTCSFNMVITKTLSCYHVCTKSKEQMINHGQIKPRTFSFLKHNQKTILLLEKSVLVNGKDFLLIHPPICYFLPRFPSYTNIYFMNVRSGSPKNSDF